jgi:hypothetical protein
VVDLRAGDAALARRGEGGSKPRAPFQYGSHIDSLPVENNLPAAANFLIDAL